MPGSKLWREALRLAFIGVGAVAVLLSGTWLWHNPIFYGPITGEDLLKAVLELVIFAYGARILCRMIVHHADW